MSTENNTPEKRVKLSPGGYARERRGQWIGGWSYVVRYNDPVVCDSGSVRSKSEYRMELMGAVNGLKSLTGQCEVELFTGCEYLSDGARRLLHQRRSDPFVSGVHAGTIKNGDLWKEFELLLQVHHVEIRWVPFRTKNLDSRDARAAAQRASYHLSDPVSRSSSPAIVEALRG